MTSLVWENYRKGGNHKLVLLAMADFANPDGGNIRPSLRTLAKKVCCSVDQTRRIVRYLEREQLVEVVANAFGGKPGTTRVYRINLNRLTASAHASHVWHRHHPYALRACKWFSKKHGLPGCNGGLAFRPETARPGARQSF